jgi:hypothetical protein
MPVIWNMILTSTSNQLVTVTTVIYIDVGIKSLVDPCVLDSAPKGELCLFTTAAVARSRSSPSPCWR